MEEIKIQLSQSLEILKTFLEDGRNLSKIKRAGDFILNAFKSDCKVISCGNGGSMSDAMHFAEELSGKFREDRKPLPAIAISDPAYMTCVANDYGYTDVFSRFIECFGGKGDVLLALSTSGSSPNIIKAIRVAKKKGLKVIGLTGKDGGMMAELCDIEIRAPKSDYSDRAQEIHLKVIHVLIDYIERKLAL